MLFFSALLSHDSEHNIINTVSRLLKMLNVKVSSPGVKQAIIEHPDFPSLLSINDALKGWKIENVSIKTDLNRLKELPLPFIVHLTENNSAYFAVVSQLTDKGIVVSGKQGRKWKTISWDNFVAHWSGIVTLMEQQEGAGEKDYREQLRKHLVKKVAPLLALGFVVGLWLTKSMLMISENGWSSWSAMALLALKASGCYIGTLLLWYEIDKHNTAFQKVCKAGKNVNCHAVLQSSGAKVFGISWSEIGFLYFVGGFLSLLLGGENSLKFLAWLNALALPFTLFSVYYQWRVAKQWCLLCVTVQVLLMLELVVNLIGGRYGGGILMGTKYYSICFSSEPQLLVGCC